MNLDYFVPLYYLKYGKNYGHGILREDKIASINVSRTMLHFAGHFWGLQGIRIGEKIPDTEYSNYMGVTISPGRPIVVDYWVDDIKIIEQKLEITDTKELEYLKKLLTDALTDPEITWSTRNLWEDQYV